MRAGLEGKWIGREIFHHTDNQVAEAFYYRGTAALSDVVLLQSLWRANLDTFWIREPNTVSHNLGKVNHILQLGFELGMDNPLCRLRYFGL
jgi:hypothetical protein